MRNMIFAVAGLMAVSAMAREVRVSSFGFDPEDSTRFIQAAIDSGAEKVIFDKMSSPWITLPLRGASKQELFFEPGVELVAKKGAFLDKNDVLITFSEVEDVAVVGYGATLRMHKSDYFKPPYKSSEWRHALSFLSCKRVRVEGLAIRDSGGDAIYIGRKRGSGLRFSEDVTVRDVLCDGNNRQGISVITVRNLLIERCRLNNTDGKPPEAGIDFEPNGKFDLLQGIVVRECEMNGNTGDGIDLAFHQLRSSSAPVDIQIENCITDGNFRGLAFTQIIDGLDCAGGKITVRNCTFKNAKMSGIDFYQKMPNSAFVKFENCRIENCCRRNPNYPDIMFTTMKRTSPQPAEVDFGRMTVVSPVKRTSVRFIHAGWNTQSVDTVSGVIVHQTPDGINETVFDEAGRRSFAPVRSLGPVHKAFDCGDVQIVDQAPGEMLSLSQFNLRNRIKYVFYASKAGACRFAAKMTRLRKSRNPIDRVEISPVGSAEAMVCKLPEAGDEFTVNVPSSGFYKMSVPSGRRNVFALTHADVPVGVLLDDDNPQNISSTAGAFFFHVKKGETFELYASGSPLAERVRVVLRDPEGMETWRKESLLFPEVYRGEAKVDGLWSVEAAKPSKGAFEDYFVDLIGIQPVLFLHSRRYWK